MQHFLVQWWPIPLWQLKLVEDNITFMQHYNIFSSCGLVVFIGFQRMDDLGSCVLPIHELLHALLVSVQRLVVVLPQRGSRLPVDAAHQVPHLRPVVLQLLGLPLRLGRDLPAKGRTRGGFDSGVSKMD